VLKNPHWEMRLLAVPAEFRNYGLGGRLISYCENKVVELGEPVLTLHTTVLMKTAAAMYLRRGYVRYPDIDFQPVPGFTVHGYIKHFESSAGSLVGKQVVSKQISRSTIEV
jgi:ribosomal protein S18 acetylase RimI-like enzyme